MTAPRVGFGTAPVLGRVGRAASEFAIESAYAGGIRYFDTARSYGWGEAESLLGRLLKGYPRESYTLASKCGLVPAQRSRRWMGFAKGTARQILRLAPSSRRLLQRAASTPTFQPSETYDVRVLCNSLDTSLRELQTPYLDLLLLHNFKPAQPGLPEVAAWLDEERRRGRIRRFGFSVEGDLLEGLSYLARHDLLANVVQVPVGAALLALPAEYKSVPIVAHSPFRFLSEHRSAGSAPLGLPDLLAALGEACACEVVVCSMFTRRHLDENAKAAAAAASLSVSQSRELLARLNGVSG